MLILATPGGFEQFVLELTEPMAPPDIPRLIEIAARYGIDILGPLPEEAEMSGNGHREAHAGGDPKALNRRWIAAFNERDWETERTVRDNGSVRPSRVRLRLWTTKRGQVFCMRS